MPKPPIRFARRGILVSAALASVALPGLAAARGAAPSGLAGMLGASAPTLLAPALVAQRFGVVTSGFRTVEHNRLVGGMPNSYHLLGRALDIQRRPGVTHAMIDAALRHAGFVLVESLDEIDHSHFAFAPALPVRTAAAPVPAKPVPLAPPAPPVARVLADNHGTLLIDVPTPAGGALSSVP